MLLYKKLKLFLKNNRIRQRHYVILKVSYLESLSNVRAKNILLDNFVKLFIKQDNRIKLAS